MVKKGRSIYTFQFNCDSKIINNLIQTYMQSEGFKLEDKNGEQYYKSGEPMVEGYKYFNYSISGNTISIYAWVRSVLGDVEIEQNSLNVTAMNYRNSLGKLFEEIEKSNVRGDNMNNNGMNFGPNTGQPINQNNQQSMNENSVQPMQQNNQFAQTFKDETTKKQEKMCEWGFWLSVFGLFASIFGVSYGVIVYILNFYFASQGLKTRKRGKAIATIVLSIISILIIMLQLMLF